MAIPEDSGDVLAAIRLGWYMAEVRGRNRFAVQALDPDRPPVEPGAQLKLPTRPAHELPLEMERSPAELRIEAQAALGVLACQIGVDINSSGSGFSGELDADAKSLAQAVKPAAASHGLAWVFHRLPGAAKSRTGPATVARAAAANGTVGSDWDALAELIYKFDAQIQDTLTAKSDTMACGYQLGRALAECYWALDPDLPDEPQTWMSWTFLLGQERGGEIGRLLGRLSAYFHPYTAAAIAGSVQVWENVAKSAAWRKDAYPVLYPQVRRWYELVLIKQDPTTLIQPYKVLTNYRLVLRTLRGFWFQLLMAALAAAAVAVFAWLLTKPSVSSAVKTLLAALGITGFSVAGLAAKVKNDAQAMLTRLKQDAYTDLITEAITTAPLPPRSAPAPKSGLVRPLTRKAKMASMMRQRSITPITPA